MIPGTVVKANGRLWIAMDITRKHIKFGANARKPGIHLMTGYWYGTNHLARESYGKIIEVPKTYKRVGYARNSYLIRRKMK